MFENQEKSALQFYSYGVVVKNKERDSNIIECYPVEHLPYVDGLIADYKSENKTSTPDIKGVDKKANSTTTAVIKAKWYPGFGESNRSSAPDVMANEAVLILRYADMDEFFWSTVGREPGIRRTEDVVYTFGGTNEPGKNTDLKNSYWIRYNSKDGYIQIHTSKSNGEKASYDLKLDGKNGKLEIKDDKGNFISLDSVNHVINCKAEKEIKLSSKKITLDGEVKTTSKVELGGDLKVSGKVNASGSISTPSTVSGSNI